MNTNTYAHEFFLTTQKFTPRGDSDSAPKNAQEKKTINILFQIHVIMAM